MSKAGGSVAGGLLVLQRTQMALDFVMAEKKHKNNQLTAVWYVFTCSLGGIFCIQCFCPSNLYPNLPRMLSLHVSASLIPAVLSPGWHSLQMVLPRSNLCYKFWQNLVEDGHAWRLYYTSMYIQRCASQNPVSKSQKSYSSINYSQLYMAFALEYFGWILPPIAGDVHTSVGDIVPQPERSVTCSGAKAHLN